MNNESRDKLIQGSVERIEQKLTELRDLYKPHSYDFKTSLNWNGLRLRTLTTVPELIQVLAQIKDVERSECEAFKLVREKVGELMKDVKEPESRLCGYHAQDWEDDIVELIKSKCYNDKLTTLENAKEELENYLSDEVKTDRQIESIINALSL